MNILKRGALTLPTLFVLIACGCRGAHVDDRAARIETIAFASCAKADQPRQIWDSIRAKRPDLFLFIGDNVYVDVPNPPTGAEDFERTYAELRSEVPVLASWDDHDYGLNDAGKEFALKEVAQGQFVAFFDLPDDSPVRRRPGVYDAHRFGPPGQRVQVILLDTRTFRDPLQRNPGGRVGGLGPYLPRADGEGSMLGKAQWAWLEAQLRKPAEVRVIASSIQVVAREHGWECWGNLPHERDRLFALIAETQAGGVFFISGDRHLTEMSRDASDTAPYPMWDFTNSGMREGHRRVDEPNRYRVGESWRTSNFGIIRIDWDADRPVVLYRSHAKDGSVIHKQAISLDALRPAASP
ncbi:MAG: alkaline phosphatase D family protein [Phycisphaeraceae bacterium]